MEKVTLENYERLLNYVSLEEIEAEIRLYLTEIENYPYFTATQKLKESFKVLSWGMKRSIESSLKKSKHDIITIKKELLNALYKNYYKKLSEIIGFDDLFFRSLYQEFALADDENFTSEERKELKICSGIEDDTVAKMMESVKQTMVLERYKEKLDKIRVI